MKRAGFTMIELIFVIVILGILAAVAIPKLAATRTDAEVSKLASNIATIQSEIGSYIVASGVVDFSAGDAPFKASSNVLSKMIDAGTATTANDTITIFDGKGTATATNACISIQVDDSNTSNVQLIVADLAGTSAICVGVRSIVEDGNVSVAGNRVSY